eukprot:gene7499-biopygen9710
MEVWGGFQAPPGGGPRAEPRLLSGDRRGARPLRRLEHAQHVRRRRARGDLLRLRRDAEPRE